MENIAFMVKKNLNLNNCLAKKKWVIMVKKSPCMFFRRMSKYIILYRRRLKSRTELMVKKGRVYRLKVE